MSLKKYKAEDCLVFRDRANLGVFPSLLASNILLEPRLAKRYGHCLAADGQVVYRKGLIAFWLTKDDFTVMADRATEKVLNNRNFIKETRKESDRLRKELLAFCKKYENAESLSGLSNTQLAKTYLEYVKIYKDYHLINLPPWLIISDKLADYLREYLENRVGGKKVLSYFTLLTTPAVPSYVFRQEIGLLEIINKIQAEKWKVGDKVIGDLITKHTKKFGWIPFDYVGPTLWDEKYFIEEVKKFINTRKPAKRELRKLREYHRRLGEKQGQARKKLKITSSDFRLFKDLQTIAVLQDNRKETATKTHVWLEKVMREELSRRTGLSVAAFRYITEEEIRDMLLGRRKFSKRSLEGRSEAVVIIREREAYEIIADKKIVRRWWYELHPNVDKKLAIKGVVASVGKAKGLARVCLAARDIDKVKKGDVLMAKMTTPDYIPAMKKAVAIVTDEGGITCHAAIVSRELDIPCIIGTKIATQSFRDNDRVEVDADKGIVRKI